MDTDLVRAPGLQRHVQQVRALPPLGHPNAGERVATVLDDGHALAVAAVARDGRVDRAAVLT